MEAGLVLQACINVAPRVLSQMASANNSSEIVEPEVNNDNQIKSDAKQTEQQQQKDDATESNQLEAKIIRQMEVNIGDTCY